MNESKSLVATLFCIYSALYWLHDASTVSSYMLGIFHNKKVKI